MGRGPRELLGHELEAQDLLDTARDIAPPTAAGLRGDEPALGVAETDLDRLPVRSLRPQEEERPVPRAIDVAESPVVRRIPFGVAPVRGLVCEHVE